MEKQQKLQETFEAVAEKLDKQLTRPIQKTAYLCAAECCDKVKDSKSLPACFERCNLPLERAQSIINREFNMVQARLQRCAETCRERAQDTLPVGKDPTPAQVADAQRLMEACAGSCADEAIQLVAKMEEKIRHAVARPS
eukprot:jgi/Mesvir1/28777/Mv09257-RA.1